jgi:hypothetical protein
MKQIRHRDTETQRIFFYSVPLRLRGGFFVLLTALLLAGVVEAAGVSYLVIVTGLGGEPAYRERFHQWASIMQDAAKERYGLSDDQIFYLSEKPELAPERIGGKSTREGVAQTLESVAERARAGDQIYIILIGHGSFRSGESRFNLPGPDLTAADFARLLEPFSAQQVVFVNAASASGDFVKSLSGENRIVVTATKSGVERNETVFGGYFVQAYAGDGADVNKDEHVSVLEAFDFARSQVSRFYDEGNRLQTEHAVLDDNGDGTGTHDPADERIEVADGATASSVFLKGEDSQLSLGTTATDDPEIAELTRQVRVLQDRVEGLKRQKDTMPADLYMEELEKLLVELAQTNREIKELEEKKKEQTRR